MDYYKHPKWYHALHALHFGFGGALVYSLAVGVFVSYVVSPAWLYHVHANGYGVFSATSFWNTKLPKFPLVNDSSSALVQSITNQVQTYGTNFDTNSDSAPVYEVDLSTPTSVVDPISCDNSGVNGALASQWQTVPIPFYAVPGNGNHRMIIYQTSTQTIWEFDHMQKIAGQWQACHGGRIDGSGNGVFAGSLGIAGSGLALIGGQVSVADLRRGVIGHTIGLSLPSTGGVSWPATKSDGSGGPIAQGSRFQLDPSLNVDSMGLSPIARLIARTAQTYGFVVWGTSSQVSITGENPISYTTRGLPSPYGSIGGSSLVGFPWDKLVALPDDYGQGGETPSILSFNSSTVHASAGQQVSYSWQSINVDECDIAGVASHLGANGTTVGYDLHSDSNYTLTCFGPGGSVSRNPECFC